MNQTDSAPESWRSLDLRSWRGVVMVIGAADTGKTTLAHYLYGRLASGSDTVYLDGDPGQSNLGPPTTMTLARLGQGDSQPAASEPRRWFVGSTSPVGHMLPLIVGAKRLCAEAVSAGAATIVFDTSGLVAPSQGGGYLKLAKIDLIQPAHLVALQRGDELEDLLTPLRKTFGSRLIELGVASTARRRDVDERRAHRARQFRDYFKHAIVHEIAWNDLPVIPGPNFDRHRLVAFRDAQGFSLALGIVLNQGADRRHVRIKTPLHSLAALEAIWIGDLRVDPGSFRDERSKLPAGG